MDVEEWGERVERVIDAVEQVRWFLVCALIGVALGVGVALLTDLPVVVLGIVGALVITPVGVVGARAEDRDG
jgi:hypothetical protein